MPHFQGPGGRDSKRLMAQTAGLWLLLAVVAVASVARPRLALWIVTAAAVISDDRQLVDTFVYRGSEAFPTIFNYRVAGLQIVDWFLAVMLAASVWETWRGQRRGRSAWAGWTRSRLVVCLGLATVPYISSCAIGLLLGNNLRLLVQDCQNHVYLIGMAAAACAVIRTEAEADDTVKVLMAALAAKTLMLIGRYLLGVGYVWGLVFRVTLSSDSIVIPVLAAGLLYLAIMSVDRPALSFLSWCLLAATGFVLFTLSSRTAAVLMIPQFMLLLCYLPKRARISVAAVALIAVGVGAALLSILRPDLADFYWWRLSSIFKWKDNQLGRNGVLLSNSVKALEIKNVLALLNQQKALWAGLGQGAVWSDAFYRIPLPYYNDGYAPGEIFHASTHLQALSQLLKMGIMGAFIYWAALVAAVSRVIRVSLGYRTAPVKIIAMGLFPLLFSMANFERVYLFAGLLMGLALRYELLSLRPATASQGRACPQP